MTAQTPMSKIQPHLYGRTYWESFQIRKFWELNVYHPSMSIQYNKIQYSTVQYGTTQYNTIQHVAIKRILVCIILI
jgi:hypothetical protein